MANFDDTDPTRRDSLTRATEDLKASTTQATDSVKQKAAESLNANRKTAAEEIEGMANAVRAAASDLQDQDREGLSHYVTELADSVSTLATGLRQKSVDELIHDVENIARKNPALFIGGSIAIGLCLARFAKASSHRHSSAHTDTGSSTRSDFRDPTPEPSLPTGFTTAEGMGRTKSTGNGNGLGNSSDNRLGGARYE